MREGAGQDHDPLKALVRGESEAAGLLVDRHGARIYRVARRLLDEPQDAEEVTQDVLVASMRGSEG